MDKSWRPWPIGPLSRVKLIAWRGEWWSVVIPPLSTSWSGKQLGGHDVCATLMGLFFCHGNERSPSGNRRKTWGLEPTPALLLYPCTYIWLDHSILSWFGTPLQHWPLSLEGKPYASWKEPDKGGSWMVELGSVVLDWCFSAIEINTIQWVRIPLCIYSTVPKWLPLKHLLKSFTKVCIGNARWGQSLKVGIHLCVGLFFSIINIIEMQN